MESSGERSVLWGIWLPCLLPERRQWNRGHQTGESLQAVTTQSGKIMSLNDHETSLSKEQRWCFILPYFCVLKQCAPHSDKCIHSTCSATLIIIVWWTAVACSTLCVPCSSSLICMLSLTLQPAWDAAAWTSAPPQVYKDALLYMRE